jgi:hypothetical protein
MRAPGMLKRVAMLALSMTLAAACGNSDERAIRDQMAAIAQALTVAPSDGELGRLGRIAALRRALAPEIQLSTGVAPRPGVQIPPEVSGRDAVLALAGRWVPPPGGVTIEFVDVEVTLDDSRTTAQVYCTAKVASGSPEKPLVDARELIVALAKRDAGWLVTSVRPEDTLAR